MGQRHLFKVIMIQLDGMVTQILQMKSLITITLMMQLSSSLILYLRLVKLVSILYLHQKNMVLFNVVIRMLLRFY